MVSRVAVRGFLWLPPRTYQLSRLGGEHGYKDTVSRTLGVDNRDALSGLGRSRRRAKTLSAIAQPKALPGCGVPARVIMCPYTFVGAPKHNFITRMREPE